MSGLRILRPSPTCWLQRVAAVTSLLALVCWAAPLGAQEAPRIRGIRTARQALEIPVIREFLGGGRYGARHPAAPTQLEQFGQLVGLWRTEQEVRRRDSSWADAGPGLWAWRYTAGGFAVQDLWLQAGAELPEYLGELERDYLVTALRTYDVRRAGWHIAWAANGFGQTPGQDQGTSTATWEDGRIVMVAPPSDFGLQRITFRDITADSFLWVSEVSQDDGRTWHAFMRIRATRIY